MEFNGRIRFRQRFALAFAQPIDVSMRVIRDEIPRLPSNAAPEELFEHLNEIVTAEVGADSSGDEATYAPLPVRPAASARASATVTRAPRRVEVSSTVTRDDSVQRVKASYAAPGSRRERRWLNRHMLAPTAEDLKLEGPQLLGGLPVSKGCFETLFEEPEARGKWKELFGDATMPNIENGNTPKPKRRIEEMSDRDRLGLIDRSVRHHLKTIHIPEGVMQDFESRLHKFYLNGGSGQARKELVESCAELSLSEWVIVDSSGSDESFSMQSAAAESRPGRLQIHEPKRFYRYLLHAVAQYMGLSSQSTTLADGRRVTTITNPNFPNYYPPQRQLSEWLGLSRSDPTSDFYDILDYTN